MSKQPISEATRRKMSVGQRRRYEDPAERAKTGAISQGIVRSPETRAKMSKAQMGNQNARGIRKVRDIAYVAAHLRADRHLFRFCYLADDTCKGPLEKAFHHNAPSEYVRRSGGRPFYVGPNPEHGYWRLCKSHHARYDHGA